MPDKDRRIICLASFHFRRSQLNYNSSQSPSFVFITVLEFGNTFVEVFQTLTEILSSINFTSIWDLSVSLVKNAQDFPGQIIPLFYLYQMKEFVRRDLVLQYRMFHKAEGFYPLLWLKPPCFFFILMILF